MKPFSYPKDFARAIVHTVGMQDLLKGLILYLDDETEDKSEEYLIQLRDNLKHTLEIYQKRYDDDISTEF